MASAPISLLDLPVELFEKIFSYMDGESLTMFGHTCKLLQSLLNMPNKFVMEVWKKACLEDIPDDICLELLQTIFPRYWMDEESVKWNIVYLNWKKWKYFRVWTCSSEVVDCEDYEITCLSVTGSWLLIGTKNRGTLWALNTKTKQKKVLFKGADVLGIQIYCSEGLSTTVEKVEIGEQGIELPGAMHDEVLLYISVQYDVLINIKKGTSRMIPRSSGLYQLRRFENCEVTVSQSVIECRVNVCKGGSNILRRFIGMPFWQILDLWKKKIVLMDWSGELLLLDENLSTIPHPMNNLMIDTSCSVQTSQVRAIKVYHWHANVAVQILDSLYSDHEMRVFINGRTIRYYPFQELSIHIKSILYISGILFLGTDLGSVMAYMLKEDDGFLELDLKDYCWQAEVSQGPVVALAVKLSDKMPILFVSTVHRVFKIKFSEIVPLQFK